MNCAQWEERIALAAGGELASSEVESHVAECAGCREFRSMLAENIEALHSLQAVEIDEAHYTAVRARVMVELGRPRTAWRGLAWIASFAALVLAVAVGWPRKEAAIPDPPRMLAAIPKAPLADARGSDKNRSGPRKPAVTRTNRTPMTVKLQTSDPNIVIYWIAD
jgi:hypothetical protein